MLTYLMKDENDKLTVEPKTIREWAGEIIAEADEDGSKQLGYAEFQKIMFRDPEFVSKFTITVV